MICLLLARAVLATPAIDRVSEIAIDVDSSQAHAGSGTDSLSIARGGDTTRTADIALQPAIGKDRRLEPGIFDMITNLPADWRDYTLRYATLDHWPAMALIAASTVGMVIYDNQMWTPFRDQYAKGGLYQQASDMFVSMGDGKFQFGLAGIFAGYGVVAGDKRALRTASQTCEVILACGAVVQLLKHLTGRESPIVTTTPTGRWQLFPNQIDYAKRVPHYDAFPSGHLSTATATLIVVANNYPEQKWIRPVGYLALAGISVGLVSQSIHWWSDYPLAFALGYTFGTLLSPNPDQDVSVKEPADEKKKDMGVNESFYHKLLSQTMIVPTYTNGAPGLAMSVRF